MKIQENDKVVDVQNRFHEVYPLLLLRFYNVEHDHFEGSPKKNEVDSESFLNVLNPSIKSGDISIDENISVDELETTFEEEFGLHVQVFRKSGGQWLQTSVTDKWPLKQHVETALRSES